MSIELDNLLAQREKWHLTAFHKYWHERGRDPGAILLWSVLSAVLLCSVVSGMVFHPLASIPAALLSFMGLVGGIGMTKYDSGRADQKVKDKCLELIEECFEEHPMLAQSLKPVYDDLVQGLLLEAYVGRLNKELTKIIDSSNESMELEKRVGARFAKIEESVVDKSNEGVPHKDDVDIHDTHVEKIERAEMTEKVRFDM